MKQKITVEQIIIFGFLSIFFLALFLPSCMHSKMFSYAPSGDIPVNTERYAHLAENPVKRAQEQPVSTFSIDVDTGSYTNVRRWLTSGQLPPTDAVRVEELLNYFSYDYQPPQTQPFSVTTEIAPAPWYSQHHLLHIGIKGFERAQAQLPPAHLVFLIDVSGSMSDANKLDLLKQSLTLLTQQLTQQDKISIVVYAGAAGLVLEPTAGDQKHKILAALDRLEAGGSTNGGEGIQLAYAIAEQAFIPKGINRILLATDGDFNVGMVDFNALIDLVEHKRQQGVALTTLGFGRGNYNDQLMEQLADVGNGHYAYIDTLNEARKVLVEELASTLEIIAQDVKVQIEFNPAVVAEYRLMGYENRQLKREDFENDRVDAGEIGAGHTVTALYELTLVGSSAQRLKPLRYQSASNPTQRADELALLRLRYKAPQSEHSQLLEFVLKTEEIIHSMAATSTDFRFAAAVAAFGQLLRQSQYLESFTYEDVLALAQPALGADPFGYRHEFMELVRLAEDLQ